MVPRERLREIMKPIGMIIPTRWEAGPVLRQFGLRLAGRGLFAGTIEGKPVLVCLSGVGLKKATAAALRLCDAGAGMLVSAGFCGALTSTLKIGDLVTGRLVTAKGPVRTQAERLELARRTNAVAVDMETQAIVEAGTFRGVPIRILRVVSDTVYDDLTPLFGPHVGFSSWRVALRLLRPAVWPLARRLRSHCQIASSRLVGALRCFCLSADHETTV
jgi:nucleoside phosphorylase